MRSFLFVLFFTAGIYPSSMQSYYSFSAGYLMPAGDYSEVFDGGYIFVLGHGTSGLTEIPLLKNISFDFFFSEVSSSDRVLQGAGVTAGPFYDFNLWRDVTTTLSVLPGFGSFTLQNKLSRQSYRHSSAVGRLKMSLSYRLERWSFGVLPEVFYLHDAGKPLTAASLSLSLKYFLSGREEVNGEK